MVHSICSLISIFVVSQQKKQAVIAPLLNPSFMHHFHFLRNRVLTTLSQQWAASLFPKGLVFTHSRLDYGIERC
jgi:hypothetical protein